MKYVIVGGVAGGASFACRLRRLDEKVEIVIYEKTNFVSYANCGLPYYVSSLINDKNKLTLQTPMSLKVRFNIDVFVNHEVISIDKDNKTIKVKNLNNNEIITTNYDKLILSPGAEAIKLTENSKRIFELKTVEDSYRLKDFIVNNNVKCATIIGGGFIGLEILENLVESNIKVTLLEGKDHVLANLDKEMASFVHHELRNHGVNLKLNTLVTKIEETSNKVVVSSKEETFTSDILIQAVGVKPNSKLAIDAKLDLDIKNTIKVNDNFNTSDKDIFAIGDVIALDSFLDNSRVNIPLAGIANKEGRELASFLKLGTFNKVKPLGTSILKIFSLAAGSTGFNEEQLKLKKINYDKVYLSPANHATYYPGASLLAIKVLFNKENYELLGAQIVGNSGVDKRIDVLATAIRFKAKAYELTGLELSYAPPFGSAKDPINMIGYLVENLKNNLVKQVFIENIQSIIKNDSYMIIDVRTPDEYHLGHIHTSINIPLDNLRERLNEIDKTKKVCLICHSALRSYIGCRILTQNGYDVCHLSGGYRLYSSYINDK